MQSTHKLFIYFHNFSSSKRNNKKLYSSIQKHVAKINTLVFILATILNSTLVFAFPDHDANFNLKNSINNTELPIVNFDRINKVLKIQDLSVNNKEEWFDRAFLNQKSITTEDDLFNAIMYQYSFYVEDIQSAWQISDPQLLLTLYFMNVTAHMWGYGNPSKVTQVGCVFKNEDHPDGIFDPNEPLDKHIPAMINSRIGCCIDHTNVLHMLLTKAGINNRIMLNPGHVFNEAFIEGKWQAFDATTNMWWHDSWEKIQNAKLDEPIYVTFFPHIGTVYSHGYYRPFVGMFRHYMLLEAIYKMAKDIKYPNRLKINHLFAKNEHKNPY